MWCWRRVEKMNWNYHARCELLLRGKDERNIIHTIKGREGNWIGHILRRNCLPKYLIEEEIERRIVVTVKRGRRRKQLLDNLKKMNSVE
jgi:hypothetical protein